MSAHSPGRTLRILRAFSQLLAALIDIASAIRALATAQREIGPATDRLDALERHRAQFEAEMEGLLLRADGKMKAASNAEARERAQRKAYEKNLDAFPLDGDEGEGEAGVPPLYAEAGEREPLQPLRLDVAPNNKAAAIMAKWAR